MFQVCLSVIYIVEQTIASSSNVNHGHFLLRNHKLF